MRLKDKVALITGGGKGIGKATVLRFLGEGASVAFSDINREDGEQLVRETAGPVPPLFIGADVTDRKQVEEMVRKVLERFDRIDILINNAGVNRDSLSWKLSEEEFDQVIDINLKSTFLCSQAVFEPMKARGTGRIINTSSVSALGNVGQVNYSAAKAGIIGLTKTLALEFAPYHITVNCVAPGFTATRMTEGLPQKVKDLILSKIPFKRMAQPEEIAAAHCFLAGDEAAYITGQVLFVDGGLTVGF
jgi:NAD(P)-dependent dehydrogenase (short-subunit alcohol dehydrogenase family)